MFDTILPKNLNWILVVFISMLVLCNCSNNSSSDRENNRGNELSQLRGVWVQARSIDTPEKAADTLTRIEAGHLNAIFVNVWAHGYAYFNSRLLKKAPEVAADYDPLAYTIEQAHQRGIAVYVWLVAGPMADLSQPDSIMMEHPDWQMIAADGRQSYWLNYNRPDVRQFIGDVVLEIVQNYRVDGIHFDYTRYPGPEWTFDPYTIRTFTEEYDLDLNLLRYSQLPAYATFRGNALAGVTTAQVLAVFDNGQPAITLNKYGAGQVVILNWDASQRQIAATSEVLKRSIEFLSPNSDNLYLLRSETNAAEYGFGGYEDGLVWLQNLHLAPITVNDADVAQLEANAVLVMPNIYLISDQKAADLADFVEGGGGVIFIDGPTRAITNQNIRTITGMSRVSGHFQKKSFLIPVDKHPLIPQTDQPIALKDLQTWEVYWNNFRKNSIDRLLQEVYQRVEQNNPDVLLTITVSANQERLAQEHFLDWQTWLEQGYIDLIIPRAYVDPNESLQRVIADWQPAVDQYGRIAFGLINHSRQNGKNIPKTPERMLQEIEVALAAGSNGVVLFDDSRMDDQILEALAKAPFTSPPQKADEQKQGK